MTTFTREGFKIILREVQLANSRFKKELEGTKSFLEIWAMAISKKAYMSYLNEFEQSIRERAEIEWGVNTRVSLDRDKLTAEITNAKKNLIMNWRSNE